MVIDLYVHELRTMVVMLVVVVVVVMAMVKLERGSSRWWGLLNFKLSFISKY
jgi:hypothetical protein